MRTCSLLCQVIHRVVCWDVNALAVDAREVDVDTGQQCRRFVFYSHDSRLKHSLTNNLQLAAAAAALSSSISSVSCTA
jgi:hypothetical protein